MWRPLCFGSAASALASVGRFMCHSKNVESPVVMVLHVGGSYLNKQGESSRGSRNFRGML